VSQLELAIHGPTDRLRSLRTALIFLAATVLSAALFFAEQAYLYSIVFAMALCLITPIWLQWQHGHVDWFQTINIIGLLHFVNFGLGAIWVVQDPINVAYDRYIVPFIPQAALYCLFGYFALLAGYFGPWSPQKARTRIEYPVRMLFVLIPAVLGFLGYASQSSWYWAGRLGLSRSIVVSTLAQFAPLFLYAWALGWMLVLSRRPSPRMKQVLWFVLVPATLLILSISLNNKSLTLSLIGIPLVSLWYARRKVPWKTLLIVMAVLILVIFPIYNTFRTLDARASAGQRLEMTSNIIEKWDARFYLDRSLGTFKARMSLINSVAVVIRDTPRWVPYARGETLFVPMLHFVVPRLLWPDKPQMDFGRQFGETFRVVHVLDRDTKIGSGVPGELYWNFSVPGIVIGMAIWGLALRFLYRRYGWSAECDPVRQAIHVVLLVQFAHFEGGLAPQTVGVIRALLLLEGYLLLSRHFGLLASRPTERASRAQVSRIAPTGAS